MNFFTSTISCVTTQLASAARVRASELQTSLPATHLWTGAVNQTPVGLEGDVGWIDKGLHLLGRLVAKSKGHQRVGVSVALQDVHVLVSAASRGLTKEKNRVILTK